jgi:hypothetical protein
MGQFDRRPDLARASLPCNVQPVRVRVPHAEDVGETMRKIRIWLDHQKIQPASFRTTADSRGYLLTLEFRTEETAERFRQQFRTAVVAPNPSDGATERSEPIGAKV